jgi:hypothetical protein
MLLPSCHPNKNAATGRISHVSRGSRRNAQASLESLRPPGSPAPREMQGIPAARRPCHRPCALNRPCWTRCPLGLRCLRCLLSPLLALLPPVVRALDWIQRRNGPGASSLHFECDRRCRWRCRRRCGPLFDDGRRCNADTECRTVYWPIQLSRPGNLPYFSRTTSSFALFAFLIPVELLL